MILIVELAIVHLSVFLWWISSSVELSSIRCVEDLDLRQLVHVLPLGPTILADHVLPHLALSGIELRGRQVVGATEWTGRPALLYVACYVLDRDVSLWFWHS